MKKNLLLIAALAAGMSASAQTSVCFMDMEVLAFDGGNTIPAGTVLCENENGKLTLAFDDIMKTFTPAAAPYDYLSVNGGEPFKITAGSTGNTNGSSPLSNGVASMISSGLVYKLETTKTGYFIFLTKLSTNKNYYVMEGQNNLLAYALGVALDPANKKNTSGLNSIYYTLPEDAFGNVDMASSEASKYLAGEAPAFTKLKTPGEVQGCGNTGDGSGFLCIASYAAEDAPATFYYWAQGSKMANNGFIFVPSDEPTLEAIPYLVFSGVEKTNEETGEVTPAPAPVAFGQVPAGINSVAVDKVAFDENAPVYNVYGQQVSKDTKGLLIQNGVKFYNR